MRLRWLVSVVGLALGWLGCHSPGPYGHSATYAPLSEEENALEGAKSYDPVMAERDKSEWRTQDVSVFGIVTSRAEGPGGSAYLTLSVRTLSERNLCDEGGEETCRVTVSEREHAVVHALAELSSEDDIGKVSVGPNSLLRVVGRIVDNVDSVDGNPVIRAKYYRHWPNNYYVTTAARSYMRR
jgi:hypothetical protein